MKYVLEDGTNVEVKIIGEFRIDKLEKDYVICTYDDNSSTQLVIILQTVGEGENRKLLPISADEKEIVTEVYKSIRKEAGVED